MTFPAPTPSTLLASPSISAVPGVPALAAPTPIEAGDPKKTFDVLPLTAEVKRALEDLGYLHPTPVQLACYDPITRGKDVIVQARTGTGKTTAFGLPIVDQLVRKSGGLQVLCLCPTRELALQVAAEVSKLGIHRGVKVTAVYGGAPMGRQIAELEEGAHVVVGTPGRVLDHLRRGTMDPKSIRALVLDEADEMLSMGFEKELNSIVEKLPKSRQTLLFSATLGNDVGRIVRNMNEPESIMLSGDQVGALDLAHYFYLQQGDKIRDLLRVLEVEDPTSAILFCNTKDDTAMVSRELKKAGFASDYISGDLDQKDRERVMTATREGRLRFLVATDVAARGIDISHLTHVINVDFPEAPEHYVHRTGRTGRAGRTGTAISLISAKNIGNLYYLRLAYGLKPIERALPTELEMQTRREADLVARVEKAAAASATVGDARSLARRLLAHDNAEGLIAHLLTEFLGSHVIAADDAAKARRAKLPPPVVVALDDASAPAVAAKSAVVSAPRPSAVAQVAAPSTSTPVTAPIARAEPAHAAAPLRSAVSASPLQRTPREPRNETANGPVRVDSLRDRAHREEAPLSTPGVASPSVSSIPLSRPARAPHRELAGWAPPAEADDETPILRRPVESRGTAPGASAAPITLEPVVRSVTIDADTDTGATVFVNVGRRDGVRPNDLLRVLSERAQIGAESVGRVRMRDRNAFVDVAPALLARAVEGLKGAVLGGRLVNAEPAKPRPAGSTELGDDPRDEPRG